MRGFIREYARQVVEITPPALENIGWRTYVIFAALNLVNASLVWAFYPETAGLTLESIDKLFREYGLEQDKKRGLEANDVDLAQLDVPAEVSQRWTSALQWAVVPRADAAVRQLKKDKLGSTAGALESGPRIVDDAAGCSTPASMEEKKRVDEHVEAVLA